MNEFNLTSKVCKTYDLRTKHLSNARQTYNQRTRCGDVRSKFWTCEKFSVRSNGHHKTKNGHTIRETDRGRIRTDCNGKTTFFSVKRSLTLIRCNVTDALKKTNLIRSLGLSHITPDTWNGKDNEIYGKAFVHSFQLSEFLFRLSFRYVRFIRLKVLIP